MKVKDLSIDEIKPGLRIKSLTRPELQRGTVISIDHTDDDYVLIYWDGKDYPHSGWYGNDCECEVVLDLDGKPEYIDVPDVVKKMNIRDNSLFKYAPLCNGTGQPIAWEYTNYFPDPKEYSSK